MKNCVLVIDSGIGGVSVLNVLRQKYPQYNYIYYADIRYAPYGNKTPKQISLRLVDIISRHIKYNNIVLVVLACNTATAMTLDNIDKKFVVPIIGIVPDINLALKSSTNNVLVLATAGTIKYSRAIKNAKSQNLLLAPQRNLAKLIDDNLVDLSKIKQDIFKILSPYKDKVVDSVVLGCTHYVFVKEYIAEFFGKIKFFDGIDRVVKTASKYLSNTLGRGNVYIKNSLGDDNINALIKKYIKTL